MAARVEEGLVDWVMGRPTTSMEAPPVRAEAGVAMRRWSPGSEPVGRMPGTTRSGWRADFTAAGGKDSAGEQTRPSMAAAWARRARRRTWVAGVVVDTDGVEVGWVHAGKDGDGEEAGGVRGLCGEGGGGEHGRATRRRGWSAARLRAR